VKIALGADHAGFALKSAVANHLVEAGHDISDFGTDSEEPVDYPAFCARVGRAVVAGEADFGIVFGGSGQGEHISANKVHGVRAALCQSEFMARLAREHNDANVLALGGRILGEAFALSIVDTFLSTGFEGGRHQRRLDQIADIEREECTMSDRLDDRVGFRRTAGRAFRRGPREARRNDE
jgi:ribose 5-phosphate isomerase B